jgi:hypothetical protein
MYQVRVITVFTVFRLLTDFVSCQSSTIFGDVNVKKKITSHIDKKNYPWHFSWLLYLYTFSLYENASLIIFSAETMRYARASSNYSDFLKRHLHLRNRLLDQGYKKIRLIRSLKKFIFRYQDLVEIYSVSAETIISDAFKIHNYINRQNQSTTGKLKTVMTLTWYRHF